MDKLLNLTKFKQQLSEQIANADLSDHELPKQFKELFKSFGEYEIKKYYKYTIKVSSKKSVCYIPNQWMYIAAICSKYCTELKKYKQKLVDLGVTDNDFEACHPSSSDKNITEEQKSKEFVSQKAKELLSSYTGEDKNLLVSFLWDYDSWGGGKNIKRDNDFTVSPCLNVANSINASSSLIGDIAKAISDNTTLYNTLMNSDEMKLILRSNVNEKKELVREKTAARFFKMAMKETLVKDANFSLLANTGKCSTTNKQLSINSYHFGRDKNQLPSRSSDVYQDVEWTYEDKQYVLYVELTPEALENQFFPVYNDAYNNFLCMEKDTSSGEYVLYETLGAIPNTISNDIKGSLQQIFYGAPGTGKSDTIKKETAGKSVIRTTFHPDSDYSTFVGAYKPVMDNVDVKVVPVVISNGISLNQNNGTYKEQRISYKFVKQAFTKAYLAAWKKMSSSSEEKEPQYLVIEEINRGNCAQIFGDLFQLLDRSESGYSTYPIDADSDLRNAIKIAFSEQDDYKLENNLAVDNAVDGYKSNYGATLSQDIQEGRILLLPPNLYIWATMNTSDQSLFPIDSAFKRRWEWKFIPIKDYPQKDWKIGTPNGAPWWQFLEKINAIINNMTSSADKQLGYFFCNATSQDDGEYITYDTFVNKVAFYLWNDVFKSYGFEDSTLFQFTNEEKKECDLTFPNFFKENGEVNDGVAKQFIDNVLKWEIDDKNKNEN